ncbi:MAG TPA: ABC transporter permease [Patescibacteria group bacterium]|nr:ABC transporter permease [Patescibacteria group bacterium]
MNLLRTIRLVIRTLLARKGRSFLTILGIVIGVAGVIIIMALGAGAQSLVLGQVTKLGSNLLSIQPGKSNEKGPPAQLFGIVVTTLTNDDARALRDAGQVPHAMAVNALVRGGATVTWRNQTIDTTFVGTDYHYPEVINLSLQTGQFFDQQQGEGNANVAVLGSTVARELFGNSGMNPIGQIVKIQSASDGGIGGVPLRVIGVIAPRGSLFFQDQDDQIYVPLTLGAEQLLGIHYVQTINVKVDSAPFISSTIADVTRVLNERHRIQRPEDEDFTVRNIADAVSILSTITSALSLFLTAMAAISLIVGGIGILNIMLVTVAERTREIGLRKAVGATNAAVRNQFLFEAGILTSLGGMIGILIGILVSFFASILMRALGYDWAFVISGWSVVLAFGVSVFTGLTFGVYPAVKASKLNPIEALRYE